MRVTEPRKVGLPRHLALEKKIFACYTFFMLLTLMGTGTSHGVPVIACDCDVCRSSDKRDKRTRCSAYIEQNDGNSKTCINIDTGPDFRFQALRQNIKKLDAVLITHAHADHLDGVDDLRVFSHTNSSDAQNETKGRGLPIFANGEAINDIKTRYGYIFHKTQLGGGKPKVDLIDTKNFSADNPIKIGSLSVIPIPMMHGSLPTSGWLLYTNKNTNQNYSESRGANCSQIKSIAYLTDCNAIPKSSIELIKKHGGTLEHAVIDGLRKKPHDTHFNFLQAMETGVAIGAKHIWLTHITHNMFHTEIEKYCLASLNDTETLKAARDRGVTFAPAYDGLVLEA